MSLALEKMLHPAIERPQWPSIDESSAQLNISVVFTAVEPTLAALKEAGALASRLGARITLIVPQVVPYPLPLDSPPVLLDWNEKRFKVIAKESSVETTVQIYLCRDRLEVLSRALKPQSLVVVGGRHRAWWPTSDERLAKSLRVQGHEVIFTKTE